MTMLTANDIVSRKMASSINMVEINNYLDDVTIKATKFYSIRDLSEPIEFDFPPNCSHNARGYIVDRLESLGFDISLSHKDKINHDLEIEEELEGVIETFPELFTCYIQDMKKEAPQKEYNLLLTKDSYSLIVNKTLVPKELRRTDDC